jgi:hypothetical protein
MAMVPPDPYAGRPRGPRIIPVGALPNQAQVPGGGMTLDALIARQKQLAGQTQTLPEMQSPMQGLAYAVQQGMHGFQEGRAERQLGEGRAALAQAMTQVDPVTGEFTPEAKATIGGLMPEEGLRIAADAVKSARDRAQRTEEHGWAIDTREDTQQAAADLAAQSQAASAHENELNRAADDARQRLADAKAEGRQDDAQAASQDLAKLNAQLATQQTEAAGKADIAKIGDTAEARRQAGIKLGMKEGSPELERYAATGTMPQEVDQWTPVPASVANAQGGDVARNPSAYRYNSKTGAVEPLQKAVSPGDVKATQDIKGKLIETRGQLNTLNRAMELAPRVFEGPTAKQRADAVVASNGLGVSPETLQQAKDTQEFFRIMDLNAVTQMAQTLSGSDSDRDVARFMQILSDPRTSAQQKQAQIQALIDKGRAYEQIQAEGVRQTGGDPDKLTIGSGGGSGAAASPKAGDVVDGYRFKGGDPSNPSSWEKV